jgi:quercetin dioxygenase-like cupin family protein
MNQKDLFFSIHRTGGGIERTLAPGITTTVYPGEQAMISVVRFEPGARGMLHHHPEEQWGYCVAGSGTRYQAEAAIEVSPGDFWRTPGNVPHTMQAGSEGLVVIDVFAPPREEYKKPGSGFGTAAG